MRRGSGAADGAVVLASALSAFAKRVTAPVVAAVAASSREGGVLFENQPAMLKSMNNGIN